MSGIDLAVLDMAGTTVRDDGAVEAAFRSALVSAGTPGGAELDRGLEHARATMGQSKIEVFRAFFDDEPRAQIANRAFEAAYDATLTSAGAEPLPGAEDALRDLRARGVRICLTTGFSAPTQARLVAALGWADLVDLTLAPGATRRGRPYPDLVLEAVLELQIDDVRAVAVAGDTISDLLAGTRAGAAIVAGVLTGSHDRAQLASAPHTHILDSIAELPALC
ncbi:MAG TPA: phosphonatase-like hydrolase [Acidimicrobiia bacterium]